VNSKSPLLGGARGNGTPRTILSLALQGKTALRYLQIEILLSERAINGLIKVL
jgi:hypothetical protein